MIFIFIIGFRRWGLIFDLGLLPTPQQKGLYAWSWRGVHDGSPKHPGGERQHCVPCRDPGRFPDCGNEGHQQERGPLPPHDLRGRWQRHSMSTARGNTEYHVETGYSCNCNAEWDVCICPSATRDANCKYASKSRDPNGSGTTFAPQNDCQPNSECAPWPDWGMAILVF